ncbi:MAG: WYL domain-containing protein, partial [Actinomycetota bacterium]|nr:WYL domain-containing protein [Actinomycetota bacterium]
RGRYGGFALLGGYSTDLTGLTHAEATALFTAGSHATSTALGMAAALASAMRKLIAAMPEPQRLSAERATERVLVQPAGWLDQPEPAGLLPVIQQAVFTDRRLKIHYPSRGEPARWRTVDRVGLVHAAGRWYLLATQHGADRTYRVSRVTAAEVLNEPADRRPGIDLEQAWRQRRQAFREAQPEFPVQVRVRAARRGQLVRAALNLTGEAADTGGWLLLDLLFADPQHAANRRCASTATSDR